MRQRLPMAKAAFGQPPKKRKKTSWLEERLAAFIELHQLPTPTREFRFAPPRMFRFDFAWPALGIAVEAEGGIWINGGHNRGAAYADDADKYNLAALNGWRVFRFTERQVRDGTAFPLLTEILTTEIRYRPSVLTEVQG